MLQVTTHCLPEIMLGAISSLTAGHAAFVVAGSSTLAKMYMSFAFRVPAVAKPAEAEKIFETAEFKNARAAQLNEAEYAPLLSALLLYIHVKGGVRVPIASLLACGGQVLYFWGRIVTGKALPVTPIAASMRYAALLLLCKGVYDTL